MYRNGIIALLVGVVAAEVAQAATLDLSVAGYARNFGVGGFSEVDSDNSDTSYDSVQDGSMQSAVAISTVGSSQGTATVSVNSNTGQIKTIATSNFDPSLIPVAEAGGVAYGVLKEEILVSGSGTVTANLFYDGFWNVADYYSFDPGSYQYQIQGNLQLSSSGGALDFDGVSFARDGNVGITDGILEATIEVFGGETLFLSTSWLSQIITGLGIVDFSNTASLFLFASDGVSLSFSDPRFLSESNSNTPPTPSPVPVPAAWSFLLAGLGTLFMFRRRIGRLTVS